MSAALAVSTIVAAGSAHADAVKDLQVAGRALTFLEKVGIASTKQHMIHHRNQLSNLDDVDLWQDLYMPFGEILPSWLWKNALARYVPGKAYMSDYMQRTGALLKVILILLVNPAIYAGVFLTVSA